MHQPPYQKASLCWVCCLAVISLVSLDVCSAQSCPIQFAAFGTGNGGALLAADASGLSYLNLAQFGNPNVAYSYAFTRFYSSSVINGIHYDFNRQRIYLTTSTMQIRQLNLNLSLASNGADLQVAVLSDQVLFNRSGSLTNIAVDWINNELYWVESTPQGMCQIMRADAARLVSCSFTTWTSLCNISLSIDPFHGYLYWSDTNGVLNVSLATARNALCSQPTSSSYVVPNLSQPVFTVDLKANLLYYVDLSSIVYTVPINSSTPSPTCVGNAGFTQVSLTTLGSNVMVYASGVITVARYFNPITLTPPMIIQTMHPDLQPLPCPPSPPTAIQVQSTSTTATLSWSPPQYPMTSSYPCAAAGPNMFSNWLYNLTYGVVGGSSAPPLSTNALTLSLSDLQAGSLYQFTLSVKGPSPVVQTSYPYVFGTSKTDTSNPSMILATFQGIWSSDLLGANGGTIGSSNSTAATVAVAYDSNSGDLYWKTTTTIYQQLSGKVASSSFSDSNLQTPSNLKYDWISMQLYWIQSSAAIINVNQVASGSAAGGSVTTLTQPSAMFVALAVDAYLGVVFWLANKVVTMKLINNQRPPITCISSSNAMQSALAVDPTTQTLYWASTQSDGSVSVASTQYTRAGCNSSVVNKTLPGITYTTTSSSCPQATILSYALGKLYFAFCDQSTVYAFPSNLGNIGNQQIVLQSIPFTNLNIRDITFTTKEIQPLPSGLSLSARSPAYATPSAPGQPSASYISNNVITLTWSPSVLPFTSSIWYVLNYTSSIVGVQQSLQVPSNNATITGLASNTSITVSVVAYSNWGQSQYSSSATFRIISVPSQIQNVRVFVYSPLRQSSNLSALVVWNPSQEVTNNYSVKVYTSGALVVEVVVQGNYSQASVVARSATNQLQYVLMANTAYSVTVVAINNAGTSNQSTPVNFTTYALSSSNVVLAVGATAVNTGAAVVNAIRLPLPLAVNTIGRELYWYSSTQGMFLRMNINGTNQMSLISTKGNQMLSNVTALAYDWVGERVYIVDSSNTLWRVPIINPDGLENVASLGSGLSVNSMIVDPFSGYVYWTTSSPGVNTLNLRSNVRSSIGRRRRQSGALTASPLAMVLDPTNGVLWISSPTGDILTYSNGTFGVALNATVLSAGMNMNQIGLPATSLALDEYRVYWTNTNSAAIFTVLRNNTASVSTLSTYSGTVLAIFSTSPGLQPLPPQGCLSYDPSNAAQLLKPVVMSSSSTTINITWSAPLLPAACQNPVLSFPALQYLVQCNNGISYPLSLNTQYVITQLAPYTTYQATVFAFNQYTVAYNSSYYSSTTAVVLSPQPSSFTAVMTTEGIPNAPQITTTYSNGTRSIFLSWNPASSTDVMGNISRLLYYVLIGAQSWSTPYTNYTLTGLQPGMDTILIRVITSNGVFNSSAATVNANTWPLPPTPVLLNKTNMSVVVMVDVTPVLMYISSYYVKVYPDGANALNTQISPNGSRIQNFTLTGLKVYTTYNITIFGTYYSNDHEESVPLGVTTGPGVPGAPVLDVNSMGFLTWSVASNGAGITQYRLHITPTTNPDQTYLDQTFTSGSTFEGSNNQYIYNRSIVKNLIIAASSSSSPSGSYNLILFASNMIGEGNGSNVFMYPYPGSDGLTAAQIGGIVAGGTAAFVLFTVVIFTIVICCVIAMQRSRRGKLSFMPEDKELSNLRKNYTKAYASNPQYAWSRDDYVCTDEDLDLLQKFPRSNLKLESFIDRGEFGEVFQGTATDILGPGTGPIPVAVKTLRKGAVIEEQKKFLAEAALMGNFNHPNIVKVLGVCVENDPVYIIMELMPGGDLLHFLRDAKVEHGPALLTVKELVQIALDVAQGCRYLQQAHFIHRDLAARNCLVSSKGADRVVKIGDFGLAKDLYSSDYYQVEGQRKLPVRWMAPEALLQGKFNMESDVWSFGVLLWEIMTFGNQPYPALNNQEVLQFVTADGRLEKPDNCPAKIYHLMQNCWKRAASERLHFEVIMEILSNYLEHLRRDSVSSDGDSDEGAGGFERQGSRKSKNSSIRSGILSLARQGSIKIRNSLRRHGSVHKREDQGTNNQLSVSSSENLVDRENNASQAVERGPF